MQLASLDGYPVVRQVPIDPPPLPQKANDVPALEAAPLVQTTPVQRQSAFDASVQRLTHALRMRQTADERLNKKWDGFAQRAIQTSQIAVKQDLRMQAPGQMESEIARLKAAAQGDARTTQWIDDAARDVRKERAMLTALAGYGRFDVAVESDRQQFLSTLSGWTPDQWHRFDQAIVDIDPLRPIPRDDARDRNAGSIQVDEIVTENAFRLLRKAPAPDFPALRPVDDNVIHEYTICDWNETNSRSNPDYALRVIDLALSNPDEVRIDDARGKTAEHLNELKNRIRDEEHVSFWEFFLGNANAEGRFRVVHAAGRPVSLTGLRDYLAAENVALPVKPPAPGGPK